jgi:hypothetical protein
MQKNNIFHLKNVSALQDVGAQLVNSQDVGAHQLDLQDVGAQQVNLQDVVDQQEDAYINYINIDFLEPVARHADSCVTNLIGENRDKEMGHSVLSPAVDILPPPPPRTTNSTALLLSTSSGSKPSSSTPSGPPLPPSKAKLPELARRFSSI